MLLLKSDPYSKQFIGENLMFDLFSMYILALRGNNSCLKNKNVAKTIFDLQFDIVMVHNSFYLI